MSASEVVYKTSMIDDHLQKRHVCVARHRATRGKPVAGETLKKFCHVE